MEQKQAAKLRGKIDAAQRKMLLFVRHQTQLAKELEKMDSGSKRAEGKRNQYNLFGAHAAQYRLWWERIERDLEVLQQQENEEQEKPREQSAPKGKSTNKDKIEDQLN